MDIVFGFCKNFDGGYPGVYEPRGWLDRARNSGRGMATERTASSHASPGVGLESDTDTDTSVVNPTRRPRPTNLQNLVTIMESEVRVATFEG